VTERSEVAIGLGGAGPLADRLQGRASRSEVRAVTERSEVAIGLGGAGPLADRLQGRASRSEVRL
jgi:hypothetical protein